MPLRHSPSQQKERDPLRICRLFTPQLAANDFSGRRHRQRRDEFDLTRILVCRQT